MVYLNSVAKDCPAKVAAKLELMEPCCSVKDRCAAVDSLSSSHERRGTLSFRHQQLSMHLVCGDPGGHYQVAGHVHV
jgi:cysteine synthase